ncbi:MAG: hypothetical protein EAZ20_01595 [Bacteroidetes bacterium]|nr:MAG: hypothetical protein EAZ20_01595 [Bacteroidota bacterium]
MENITKNITQHSPEELERIGKLFSESQFAKDKLERAKKAIEKLRPQLEKKIGAYLFEDKKS